ncbi:lysine N(6)-hydroxylase/L-ornithine N(5)-oxygenase family protein [Actinosynnema sp. NPDC047251]|uniref:L-lysine N6-monooxygenase MbtG n=1 Tax=Saccharothrix espanaensis (strain ATCC 51144 / DSM 44229 / JCM 9112 / NBRC 15066 / NRRL 15764) TaxID=1179773 RepID=K0K741_SACES|nr:lysine N(6)-hydroxylase/L-ornithine N(5)-oxygenase family protein [Saccharothrix espanaensis]CCH33362.1 L-lysine 6-monooxygenase (NADPH) [Saccharothrix espanaensis DSM 44229]
MPQPPVFDVLGVGFGPSNLALAIAVTEYNATARPEDVVTAHFLERQRRFGWHRGMLIDDATMQVSFLKDLVTLRNPSSSFSFLNYLHGQGRLVDFINHKNMFPLRVEFHDYFEWAAGKVDDLVSYDHDVVSVAPVAEGGVVTHFDVTSRTPAGEVEVRRARNLVLATGLRACLPDGVTPSDRVWHNRDFLHRVTALEDPRRLVVVGAGQSGAEVAAFLHDKFRDAEVCAVFARYGYSPADDSPFANRIFDPAAVDDFYTAPEDVKRRLMDYHANTNYAVVDNDLIAELYRRVYREKVLGAQRLRLLNLSRVAELDEHQDGVRVTVESLSDGSRTTLDADAVVYATGYREADPTGLLGDLAARCRHDELDRLRIGRDYRLETDDAVLGGIYLQGGTEHTHGISSSLLSNTSVRVGEILQSVLDRRPPSVPVQPAYAVSAARPV